MRKRMSKKRILSLLLTVCMMFTLFPSFTLPVFAGEDAITATIKTATDTTGTSYGGDSLAGVITASAAALSTITSIEIMGGTVTDADFAYIKTQKDSLTALTNFKVDDNDNVIAVADIPGCKVYECPSAQVFPVSLKTIYIAKTKIIGENAFQLLKNLADASFPDVTSIGISAFDRTGLQNISFPNATNIGSCAFRKCTSLTGVSFPKATDMGSDAFSGCTNLANVDFPELITLGDSAFASSCLISIDLPNVETMGGYVLNNCQSLTQATFPKLTKIGGRVFGFCDKLSNLKLPAIPPTGFGPFSYSALPHAHFGSTNATTLPLGEGGTFTFVDENGVELTDTALTSAQAAYKADTSDDDPSYGNLNDNRWYGWDIVKSYTVTFDSQSANTAANPTTKTVTEPVTNIDTLPIEPLRAGYIFGGWYTQTNGGGTQFTEATTVNANITVYANWTQNAVIRVKLNGGVELGGASLSAVVTASKLSPESIGSVEITAGIVTTEDWRYIKSLYQITSLKVDDTVTTVADIPDGTNAAAFFSTKMEK